MANVVRATYEFLRFRKRDYQLTFDMHSVHAQRVLMDLAKFCRASETCVVPGDQRMTDVLEGRREVFLRIQNHLNLPADQLYAMFAGRPFNPLDLEDKED